MRSENSRPLAHHHFDETDEYSRNRQAKHDCLHPQQQVPKLIVVLCGRSQYTRRRRRKLPKAATLALADRAKVRAVIALPLCAPMTKLAPLS